MLPREDGEGKKHPRKLIKQKTNEKFFPWLFYFNYLFSTLFTVGKIFVNANKYQLHLPFPDNIPF